MANNRVSSSSSLFVFVFGILSFCLFISSVRTQQDDNPADQQQQQMSADAVKEAADRIQATFASGGMEAVRAEAGPDVRFKDPFTAGYVAIAKKLGYTDEIHHPVCDPVEFDAQRFRSYSYSAYTNCCIADVPSHVTIVTDTLGANDSVVTTIGVNYPFFGVVYSPNAPIYIGSNGQLTGSTVGSTSPIPNLDSPGPPAQAIGAFWRDLQPAVANTGIIQKWTYRAPGLVDCTVIRWANFVDTVGLNRAAFRAHLCSNGVTKFEYESVGTADGAQNGFKKGGNRAYAELGPGLILENVCYNYVPVGNNNGNAD
eukprot:GHVS01070822.1.p1 GENE.GHVS01070822.1~~GHVS01070822.1.p1  ORF type:complete len:313 (-),score=28.84 GHVS01070822.1:421-1359(-)